MKASLSSKKSFALTLLMGTTVCPAAFSQTVISPPNYVVTNPNGGDFIYDVNGQDSGGSGGFGVHNSLDFTLNAGASYLFNMNTAGNHPVDICTNNDTGSPYSGASAQGVSGGGAVTLTIPATNYPTTLYYICDFHAFYGVINVAPPAPPPDAKITKTLITTNIVLTFSGGTNTIQLIPQYRSNLVSGVWLPVPGYTNTFTGIGTNNTTSFQRLDAICGPNVFLRISQVTK